jgi:hypothetical protein
MLMSWLDMLERSAAADHDVAAFVPPLCSTGPIAVPARTILPGGG